MYFALVRNYAVSLLSVGTYLGIVDAVLCALALSLALSKQFQTRRVGWEHETPNEVKKADRYH